MRILLSLLFFIFSVSLFAQQKDQRELFFDYGKHELSKLSKLNIDKLLEGINPDDLVSIQLNGFTDSDGSKASNKILSEKRIAAVTKYLEEKGYENVARQENPYGEDLNKGKRNSEEVKQHDRRVDLVIFYTKRENPFVKNQIFRTSRRFIQTFKANANGPVEITGKKGCHVSFPDSIFVDKNGNVYRGPVVLELIEALTKSDMIANRLQTVSRGQLIESAGMVYLRALADGKELRINYPRTYTIELPRTNQNSGFKLFIGDTSKKEINWFVPDGSFGDELEKLKSHSSTNKFALMVSTMGWINCDRFLGKAETADVGVLSYNRDLTYMMVFKSLNSVMAVIINNGVASFPNVPVGKEVDIIAFGESNGKLVYGSAHVTIFRGLEQNVPYSPISSAELENKLAQLNK